MMEEEVIDFLEQAIEGAIAWAIEWTRQNAGDCESEGAHLADAMREAWDDAKVVENSSPKGVYKRETMG